MTRKEAIAILNETTLGLDIGLGGYSGTAAYKLANGDISATTDGLSDRVVEAINAVGGDLDWSEVAE